MHIIILLLSESISIFVCFVQFVDCTQLPSSPAADVMDYSLPDGSFQIVFNIDAMSGDMACAEVTINEDSFVEGLEQFVVTVTEVSPLVEQSGLGSVTISITDNDGM